jgi:hypothetical protein
MYVENNDVNYLIIKLYKTIIMGRESKWSTKDRKELLQHVNAFNLMVAQTKTFAQHMEEFKHSSGQPAMNQWKALTRMNFPGAIAAQAKMRNALHNARNIKKSTAKKSIADTKIAEKASKETGRNLTLVNSTKDVKAKTTNKEIPAEDDNPVIGLFKKAFLRQPKQVGIGEIEHTKDKLIIRDITILFSLLLIVIYSI